MSHESETPVPIADSAHPVSVSAAGTHKGKGVGKRTIKNGEQRTRSMPSSSSSHSRPPQGDSSFVHQNRGHRFIYLNNLLSWC